MQQTDQLLGFTELAEGRSTGFIEFLISIVSLILLTFLLKYLYIKRGRSIGDRQYFSSMFFLWSLSVFLIVSVIKTSFILSLGMVGALSIVRFRNAIKDIEQVMYLLVLISFSISLAANQYLFAFITLGFIYTVPILEQFFGKKKTINEPQFINIVLIDKMHLYPLIEYLSGSGNRIISIDHSSNNSLEVNATFNNLNIKEISDFTEWIEKRSSSYRISVDYFI